MKQDRSTFCALPWIHLSTRPNGHLRLCCTANASSAGATNDKQYGGEVGILKNKNGKPANLNTTDLISAWNDDYMKTVRLQMLSGQEPPSCAKCYKEERAGHRSKRNWETEYWEKRLPIDEMVNATGADGSVKPQIAYVDLRLGTKCNLKCIMCSPHDSSLWVGDWKKLYPQIQNDSLREIMQWNNNGRYDDASYDWHKDNPKFWEQLYDQLPNIKQLYFAGGESTIIPEHYTLLEECVRRGYAGGIELRYNSNGIELPDKLFELWSHFQRVRFHFSIDSFGDMNSYIRYPSAWPIIEQNLKKLDEADGKIEVTIACAVQALNIFYIPDFISWKLDQNFKRINTWPLGAGLINFHFVYHPANLNVKVLPDWFKEKVRAKYEAFYPMLERRMQHIPNYTQNTYGIPRLKGLVNFMESEDWSVRMPEFVEYIRLMDKIRGTSFEETFPEMALLVSPESDSENRREALPTTSKWKSLLAHFS